MDKATVSGAVDTGSIPVRGASGAAPHDPRSRRRPGARFCLPARKETDMDEKRILGKLDDCGPDGAGGNDCVGPVCKDRQVQRCHQPYDQARDGDVRDPGITNEMPRRVSGSREETRHLLGELHPVGHHGGTDHVRINSLAAIERRVHMDWKRKLTSLKLWTSVTGFVKLIAVASGMTEAAAAQIAAIVMAGAVVIGYMIGEGLVYSTK